MRTQWDRPPAKYALIDLTRQQTMRISLALARLASERTLHGFTLGDWSEINQMVEDIDKMLDTAGER